MSDTSNQGDDSTNSDPSAVPPGQPTQPDQGSQQQADDAGNQSENDEG